MRDDGLRFRSSCAPAVSLSACCATFLLSIVSRGFSPANGSARKPSPFLQLAGGVVSPPVYSGIVPSLLPAFSAPTAVSVVPSCLASSADTAANAPFAHSAATATAINDLHNMIQLLLRMWS